MYNLEHVGGPLHLRRAVAPDGQSRGYTYASTIPQPVGHQAADAEPAAAGSVLASLRLTHYSLRTVVLNGWVVWVGYVDDDYAWDGWPDDEVR